jgi:hypothetical protein
VKGADLAAAVGKKLVAAHRAGDDLIDIFGRLILAVNLLVLVVREFGGDKADMAGDRAEPIGGGIDGNGNLAAADRSGDRLGVSAAGSAIVVSGGQSPAFTDAFELASSKDLVMQAAGRFWLCPTASTFSICTACLWRGDTPEARQAVADAPPMLRKARDVAIVEIPEQDDDRSAAMVSVSDVAAWLGRHGVTATARVPEAARHEPAAAQLEKVASDAPYGLCHDGQCG